MMIDELELTEEQRRSRVLDDVRSLLTWLDAHPEIPLPTEFGSTISIYAWDTKDQARAMARAMGTFEKNGDEQFLRLTKRFGTVKLQAVFSRTQVCERIVLGTEEIPERIEPEKIIPAHIKEIVEWHCPSLLGNEEAA